MGFPRENWNVQWVRSLGAYFGCFRDKYGIEWIVEFDPKNRAKT